MAAVDGFDIPLQGGGFGAFKTGIMVLSGAYETGGFTVPFVDKPIFILTDVGYGAVFDEANTKVKLVNGATELAEKTDVSGVKVLVITKGV